MGSLDDKVDKSCNFISSSPFFIIYDHYTHYSVVQGPTMPLAEHRIDMDSLVLNLSGVSLVLILSKNNEINFTKCLCHCY